MIKNVSTLLPQRQISAMASRFSEKFHSVYIYIFYLIRVTPGLIIVKMAVA